MIIIAILQAIINIIISYLFSILNTLNDMINENEIRRIMYYTSYCTDEESAAVRFKKQLFSTNH